MGAQTVADFSPAADEVGSLRLHLAEIPARACPRFRALLIPAMDRGDVSQVQHLVAAAETLLAADPSLRQWHAYASAYLAVRVDYRPSVAAGWLDRLLEERNQLPPDLRGRVWLGRGIVHEMAEEWDHALRCYDEGLAEFRAAGDELGQAKILNSQMVVYNKGQYYDEAIECARASIALLNRRPDDAEWQTHLGIALNELGLAQMELGQLADAAVSFEQSLSLDLRGHNLQGQGICRNNLGHVFRKLNDPVRAEAEYIRAIQLLRQEDQRELAEGLWGLGVLKSSQGALDGARRLLDEALAMARASRNDEINTEVLLARADVEERSGNPAAALEENRQAVESVESLRANLGASEARIRLQGARIRAYECMVARLFHACEQVGAGRGWHHCAEAFRYCEMAKSRALVETLARGRAIRPPDGLPPEALKEEAELRAALQELYQEAEPDARRVADLEKELQGVRQRIRLMDAEFESFHTVAPLSLEEVMARLPQDAVLLEYFTAGADILAFVITSTGAELRRLPLQTGQLERAFEPGPDGKLGQLRHLMPDGPGRVHEAWHLDALCRDLVEPLGEQVWNAPLLCIAPHGLLHYLPFHAMGRRVGNERRPLLMVGSQPRPIVYVPNATVLLDYCQRKTSEAALPCLAVGFDGSLLTYAESEARRVARITQGQSLTGAQARRDTLFERAGNFRYLHLACHGQFNPNWPLASRLTLADGVLDVEDVFRQLRLNAELVTLNACETGRARLLQGDELVGMARAFLYAGTPSVLVNHWRLDDLVTGLLMEHFYSQLMLAGHQGSGPAAKARALSQAQAFLQNLTGAELRDRLLASGEVGPAEVDRWLPYAAALSGQEPAAARGGRLLTHPFWWASFFLVGERLG